MLELDSIHQKVEEHYGNSELKIIKASDTIFVDGEELFISFSVSANGSAVLVSVGWERQCDTVYSEAKHCTLDAIVVTVNNLCLQLSAKLFKLYREVPNATPIPSPVDSSFDPSGASLPIG